MGLSKVYRGYVIEDINGQWYIRNTPNYTGGFPFSPGPHGGWTVATRQVDKLIEYINRGAEQERGKYRGPEPTQNNYSSGSSSSSSFSDDDIAWVEKLKVDLKNMDDESFEEEYNFDKRYANRRLPGIIGAIRQQKSNEFWGCFAFLGTVLGIVLVIFSFLFN